MTAPATESARQWSGWGTALKPAMELICLARKPLGEKIVAANVQRFGTGALNIDGCRVGTEQTTTFRNGNSGGKSAFGRDERTFERVNPPGRWPANLILDGSEEATRGFPETQSGTDDGSRGTGGIWSPSSGVPCGPQYGDSGSAARFFYTSKADAGDRLGSKHPTVKPVDLIAYLCRLICPPGGVILDPFAGSGTTGMACMREGFRAILIEREAAYVADIRRRLAHVKGEDAPLFTGTTA